MMTLLLECEMCGKKATIPLSSIHSWGHGVHLGEERVYAQVTAYLPNVTMPDGFRWPSSSYCAECARAESDRKSQAAREKHAAQMAARIVELRGERVDPHKIGKSLQDYLSQVAISDTSVRDELNCIAKVLCESDG